MTGLPDRPMFDANLRLMLAEGAKTDLSSGLLLVTIDRREQLKSRFGIRGVDDFEKSIAAVIGRAIRKQDLVCRLTDDSYGILFPTVDIEGGRKLAQVVRNSVRLHTFRLNDIGPEVLVTASFGYTTCSRTTTPSWLSSARAMPWPARLALAATSCISPKADRSCTAPWPAPDPESRAVWASGGFFWFFCGVKKGPGTTEKSPTPAGARPKGPRPRQNYESATNGDLTPYVELFVGQERGNRRLPWGTASRSPVSL